MLANLEDNAVLLWFLGKLDITSLNGFINNRYKLINADAIVPLAKAAKEPDDNHIINARINASRIASSIRKRLNLTIIIIILNATADPINRNSID